MLIFYADKVVAMGNSGNSTEVSKIRCTQNIHVLQYQTDSSSNENCLADWPRPCVQCWQCACSTHSPHVHAQSAEHTASLLLSMNLRSKNPPAHTASLILGMNLRCKNPPVGHSADSLVTAQYESQVQESICRPKCTQPCYCSVRISGARIHL